MFILIFIEIVIFVIMLFIASKLKGLKNFFNKCFDNFRYLNTVFIIILFILYWFNLDKNYDFLIALFTEIQIIFIGFYLICIVKENIQRFRIFSFLTFVTLVLVIIKNTSLKESIGLEDVICFYGVVNIYFLLFHLCKILVLIKNKIFFNNQNNESYNNYNSKIQQKDIDLNDISGFANAFNFKLGYPPNYITLYYYKIRFKKFILNIILALIIIFLANLITYIVTFNYYYNIIINYDLWYSTCVTFSMIFIIIIVSYFQEKIKGNNIIKYSSFDFNGSDKEIIKNKKFKFLSIIQIIIGLIGIIICIIDIIIKPHIVIILINLSISIQLLRIKLFKKFK